MASNRSRARLELISGTAQGRGITSPRQGPAKGRQHHVDLLNAPSRRPRGRRRLDQHDDVEVFPRCRRPGAFGAEEPNVGEPAGSGPDRAGLEEPGRPVADVAHQAARKRGSPGSAAPVAPQEAREPGLPDPLGHACSVHAGSAPRTSKVARVPTRRSSTGPLGAPSTLSSRKDQAVGHLQVGLTGVSCRPTRRHGTRGNSLGAKETFPVDEVMAVALPAPECRGPRFPCGPFVSKTKNRGPPLGPSALGCSQQTARSARPLATPPKQNLSFAVVPWPKASRNKTPRQTVI